MAFRDENPTFGVVRFEPTQQPDTRSFLDGTMWYDTTAKQFKGIVAGAVSNVGGASSSAIQTVTASGSDWCAAISAADVALGAAAGKIIVPATLVGTCASPLTLAYNGLAAHRTIEFGVGTFTGSITALPNNGASPPQQAVFRFFGQGPGGGFSGVGASNSASILNLTNSAATGKIDTRGTGFLEIAYLTIQDTNSDCTPFVFDTNTVMHVHDNTFNGSASGVSACNDGFILGGTANLPYTGTVTSPFGGYGTIIEKNLFTQIRRMALFQSNANSIEFVHNTADNSCGFTTGGAVEINTTLFTASSYFAGNLIEVTNYRYGFNLVNGGQHNLFIGNGLWDDTATFYAGYNFGTNSTGNTVIPSEHPTGTRQTFAGINANNNTLMGKNGSILPLNVSVGGTLGASSFGPLLPETSATPVVTGLSGLQSTAASQAHSVTLTAGHTVFVFAVGGATAAPPTIDTLGNSYAALGTFNVTGVSVARCVAGGATTVTVSNPGGASSFMNSAVVTVSNLPCAGALLGQSSTTNGTSTTPALGTPLVTQTPNEIVFGAIDLGAIQTPTAGSGYALQVMAASAPAAAYVEWQVFPTPGTSNTAPSTLSGSTNWLEGAFTVISTPTIGTALKPWPAFTTSSLNINATTFANLGTPANGTFYFCSDCTLANPCAGAGTGAFAKRLNGVWVCN